jgi:beta-lactam-binding protein with PASTA domain
MLRKTLIYMAIGIGTIAGIALVLNLAMSVFVGGRQVTVPDLRGLDENAARSTLDQLGLRYELVDEHFSVEYPESTVADQNPLPGRIVKQGRKVLVTMSKGGEFYDVPYCIGKPLRTARILLERAGFMVGSVARVPLPRGYPEEVLSTEPLPVNDGLPDPKVILPDLRDHAYLPVKMRLERLGLFVKETNIDEDFNALRARVVLHRPVAGFVVSRGDTVSLVISSRNEEERSL